ncbi:MAG: hypothetical protein ABII20_04730 [Candidatus Omnitrophota bacterium]|nr:hypothetical protein [Candidatus Omnitrophota bacterium]MBU2528358.1 hypothetical protein [bacterium]MBU3930615.1 hypothetical protein [bacterium]MBU4122600.1 hypothetical protein [bacterium]
MNVIKIGGEVVGDPRVFEEFRSLLQKHLPAAVVFGAGVQISSRLKAEDIPFGFYKGERITTADMLALIDDEFRKMAKNIASMLSGLESVFVSGSEVFTSSQKSAKLGFVGEIVSVDISKIKSAQAPVILVSPIASSETESAAGHRDLYNVNADVSASRLAAALAAPELIYCTKVNGVNDSSGNLIEKIDADGAAELMAEGVIDGGMIPKVRSALESLKSGVGSVRIGRTLIM